MSTEVLRRRGTASENASFAGGEGEFTVDLTNGTIIVHTGNGVAGGVPLARADLQNVLLASLLNKGIAAVDMSNVQLADILTLGVAAKDLSNITLSQFSSKGLAYKTLGNVKLSALGNFAGTDDTNSHAGGVAYKDLSNVSLSKLANFIGDDDTATHAGGVMLKDGSNAIVGSSSAFASKTLNNTSLSSYSTFQGNDDSGTNAGGLAYKDLSNVDLATILTNTTIISALAAAGLARSDLSNAVVSLAFINTLANGGLALADLSNTSIDEILAETGTVNILASNGLARSDLSNVSNFPSSVNIADKTLSNVDPEIYSKGFKNMILNPNGNINTTGYIPNTVTPAGSEMINKWYSGTNTSFMSDVGDKRSISFKGEIYQNLDGKTLLGRNYVLWFGELSLQSSLDAPSVTVFMETDAGDIIKTQTITNDDIVIFDLTEESLDAQLYNDIIGGSKTLRLRLVNNSNSSIVFITELQLEPGTNPTTFELRPYEFEYAACALNDTFVKKSDLTKVYKPAGSVAFNLLPNLSASVLGNVYNITDDFTTDSRFVEGTGKSYTAGTNIVVINAGTSSDPVYKLDALPGIIDLSGYVPSTRTINGSPLSSNVNLDAAAVGALPDNTVIPNPIYITGVTVSIAAGSTSATIDVSSYITSGNKYIPTVLLSEANAANLLSYCQYSSGNVTVYSNSQAVSDTDGVIVLMPVITTASTVKGSTNGRGEVMSVIGDINTILHNLNSGSN